MVRRRLRRRDGRADERGRGGPRAGELRRARGSRRCGWSSPRATRPSAAASRSGSRRPGTARRSRHRARSTAGCVDEVPVDPARGRVYAEGWQSWSPTTWYPRRRAPARGRRRTGGTSCASAPGPRWPAEGVQGEGLLVVDPGTGAPARFYGALDAIPASPRSGPRCEVTASWSRPTPRPDALGCHRARLGRRGGAGGVRRPLRRTRRACCRCVGRRRCGAPGTATSSRSPPATSSRTSTRSTSTTSRSTSCRSTTAGASASASGLRPAPRFGSLEDVVRAVRDGGRRAGHLAGAVPRWARRPRVARRAPGLARRLRRAATGARTWSDSTSPTRRSASFLEGAAASRCASSASTTSSSTSSTPAPSPDPATAARTRSRRTGRGCGWSARRSGADAYLLGCGAPILPSVGLVDAMRVSPDTFHEGGEDGSRGLRGLMPLAARAWQQGRFWVNDPDCLVARPSYRAPRAMGGGGDGVRRPPLVLRPDRRARRLGARVDTDPAAQREHDGPFPDETVRAGAEVAAASSAALSVEAT